MGNIYGNKAIFLYKYLLSLTVKLIPLVICLKFVIALIFAGHEFAFVAFLFCLFKIGACDENDLTAVGCKVFPQYVFLTYFSETTMLL